MVEHGVENMALFIYGMTPLIGLLINAVIQISGFRSVPKIGLLRSVHLGFFAGICSLAAIDLLYRKFFYFLFQNMMLADITNMIAYSALGYCYFNFVCLGETARRIRMLIEIYHSKEGLSLKEILGRYNAREVVGKRIDRLLNSGQLKYEDGKYLIGKPIVLLLANWVILLKLVLLGKRSEFDRT